MSLQLGNPFDSSAWSWADHAPVFACGFENVVQIWDPRTWRRHGALPIRRSSYSTEMPLALSPDGKTLAAQTTEGTLELWDVPTREKRHTFRSGYIDALRFTPDGRQIVETGPGETTFREATTGRSVYQFPTGGDIALSPDGQSLAVVGNLTEQNSTRFSATLWDIKSQQRRLLFTDPSGVAPGPVAFSPDGRTLATVGANPHKPLPDRLGTLTVKLWDAQTGGLRHILFGLSNSPPLQLQFTSDGRSIAAVGQQTIVWNVATGHRLRRLTQPVPQPYHYSNIFSHGDSLVADTQGSIIRTDLRTGEQRRQRKQFVIPAALTGAVWSPAGPVVAMTEIGRPVSSSLSDSSEAGALRLWDLRAARVRWTRPQRGQFLAMRFSPSGGTILSNRTLEADVFRTNTGRAARKMTDPAHPDWPMLLSPDGHTLARQVPDAVRDSWQIVDVRTGRLRQSLSNFAEAPSRLCFSPDGRWLAGIPRPYPGGPQIIQIWNLRTATPEPPLPMEDDLVEAESLAWSPDSETLAVRRDVRGHSRVGDSADMLQAEVQLWDVRTHSLKVGLVMGRDSSARGALAFSPDGKYLAASHGQNVTVYDVATEKVVLAVHEDMPPQDGLPALAFSPDGTLLIAAGDDGRTRLWRLRDGHLCATLMGLSANGRPTADWIITTPTGDYNASPGAERLIRWRIGNTLHPAGRYAKSFRRPDLVRQALSGG